MAGLKFGIFAVRQNAFGAQLIKQLVRNVSASLADCRHAHRCRCRENDHPRKAAAAARLGWKFRHRIYPPRYNYYESSYSGADPRDFPETVDTLCGLAPHFATLCGKWATELRVAQPEICHAAESRMIRKNQSLKGS
jgi:hypothetical protein